MRRMYYITIVDALVTYIKYSRVNNHSSLALLDISKFPAPSIFH